MIHGLAERFLVVFTYSLHVSMKIDAMANLQVHMTRVLANAMHMIFISVGHLSA